MSYRDDYPAYRPMTHRERERDEQDRRVHALVGVDDGRLCVNMSWYYLEGQEHWDFLAVMFGPDVAGFPAPRALDYEHNKRRIDGTWGVDWNRLRISRRQCMVANLSPPYAAAERIREWMRGDDPWERFRICFTVGEYASPRYSPRAADLV